MIQAGLWFCERLLTGESALESVVESLRCSLGERVVVDGDAVVDTNDLASRVRRSAAATYQRALRHAERVGVSRPRNVYATEFSGLEKGALCVALTVSDELGAISRHGDLRILNHVALWLPSERAASLEAVQDALCGVGGVVFGYVCTVAEFREKHFERGERRVAAQGISLADGIPGLYWRTYFGEAFSSLVGERLAVSGAPVVRCLQSRVVVIGFDGRAGDWDTEERRSAEARVCESIGVEHFSKRLRGQREVVAPDWLQLLEIDKTRNRDQGVRQAKSGGEQDE